MEDKNANTSNSRKPTDPIDELITIPGTHFQAAILQENVWAGEVVKKWINHGNIPDEQVTPNGVDLTVDKVLQQRGNVVLTKEKEDINSSKGMLWKMQLKDDIVGLPGREGWILEPGYYIVQWAEHIHIPPHAIGLLSPRSTLIRTCATIYGAVWDRGYHGFGQSGLHIFDYLLLEKGTALAQMCFIEASVGGKLYDGQYQSEGENVDASEEKENNKENNKEE